MLANGLSNMLFKLEMWPIVPPDFHYPSSFQLRINWEAVRLEEFVRFPVFNDFQLGKNCITFLH